MRPRPPPGPQQRRSQSQRRRQRPLQTPAGRRVSLSARWAGRPPPAGGCPCREGRCRPSKALHCFACPTGETWTCQSSDPGAAARQLRAARGLACPAARRPWRPRRRGGECQCWTFPRPPATRPRTASPAATQAGRLCSRSRRGGGEAPKWRRRGRWPQRGQRPCLDRRAAGTESPSPPAPSPWAPRVPRGPCARGLPVGARRPCASGGRPGRGDADCACGCSDSAIRCAVARRD